MSKDDIDVFSNIFERYAQGTTGKLMRHHVSDIAESYRSRATMISQRRNSVLLNTRVTSISEVRRSTRRSMLSSPEQSGMTMSNMQESSAPSSPAPFIVRVYTPERLPRPSSEGAEEAAAEVDVSTEIGAL